MTRISSDLLADTLNLVQLARETALAKGNQDQAKRLNPVVNHLNNLVGTGQSNPNATAATTRQTTGPVGTQMGNPTRPGSLTSAAPDLKNMEGFGVLLQAARQATQTDQQNGNLGRSNLERMNMVQAMADGNMKDTEIARQMGMTLEEVQMVLSLRQKSASQTVSNGNRSDL